MNQKQQLAPKSIESYLENKVALKAKGTQKNIETALNKLNNFITEKEGVSLDT